MTSFGKVVNLDIDNVYYEVSVPNNGTSAIKAQFNETRIEPILSNSSDWQLLISDFNLPAASIPLFLFEQASTPPDFSGGYWISGGVNLDPIVYQDVVYSPKQSTTLNSGGRPPYPYDIAIYNYTLFISQINTAFDSLWTSMGLITLPPRVYYDPSTQLFSIYFDAANATDLYDGANYNTSIKIFLNYKLQKFFKWPAQYQASPLTQSIPPLDYLLMISNDNLINIPAATSPFIAPYNVNLVKFNQEFSTISKWMRYTKILFYSSTVPVFNRQVGDVTSVGNNQNFSILTSYELADGELFDRSNISFNATAANKWISLLPFGSLRTFDISVEFMGATSNDILPGYITPGEKFSFTVWFNKKELLVRDEAVLRAMNNLGPMLAKLLEEMRRDIQKEREDDQVMQAITPQPPRIVPSSGARRGRLL